MRHILVVLSSFLMSSLIVVWSEPARAQQVERGPYLQQATSNNMTVRWRTDIATDAVVRFGTDVTVLDRTEAGSSSGTEHEVVVTGLTPGTQYYYSVGNSVGALAGGDASYTFRASPTTGTQQNTRVWVIGDSGTANSNARRVRDAYLNHSALRPADLWLMLGDNAYDDGTDAEYQAAVFDTYPTILRNTPLWTTLGNHDGHSADSTNEQGPYYDIFSLPRNAEAGGVASGTEAYYSFDYANIHFITLDSYDTDTSVGGAMLTWLENDLASTAQEWLIAFWHHPPYTKGSHNSDTESQLIDMRERALPILESYGVDLVLTGHSHSYERSFLIDGHYGNSNTFSSSMLIDGGSGRADGDGSYAKSPGTSSNQGAVYAVAGSSGKTSSGSLNHPVMYLSLQQLGSMILDIDGDRLNAEFIDDGGARLDYFTIQKGAGGGDTEQPTPVSNLTASGITSTSVTLNWSAASDNVGVTGYRVSRDGVVVTTTSSLNHVDNNLAPNTAYFYEVVAVDAAGNESTPTSVSATTSAAPDVDPPTPVSNLTASGITSTSVTLSWSAASDNVGVAGYRVSRDGSVVSTGSSLNFVDTGLTPDTAYFYDVVAFDAVGNESTPTSVSVTTSAAPDVDPPTPISNLTASGITSTSVTLIWSAASDNVGVTGYRVSRDGSVVSTSSNLNYVDSGLAPNTAYTYSVVAFDAAGNESTPTSVSVTTTNAPDVDAPTPVSNLRASGITSTSVTLDWSAASDNVAVTGYRVSRDGSVVSIGSSLSYVDTGLSPNTAYSYSVVALDAAGNESTPTSVSVTTSAAPDVDPPTPVSNLTASGITSTSVTLDWSAASDNVGITGYRVSRDGSVVSTGSLLSYVDTGLTPNTAYSYSVVALDAAGNESTPTSVSATTSAAPDVDAPTPVSNLRASGITSTSVTLDWSAASDNVAVAGYRVSRDGSVISTSGNLNYVDTGLAPNTAYSYSVVALDAAGNESTPTSVSATTQTSDTGGNIQDSGGGSIGIAGVMMLLMFVVVFRRRDVRLAVRTAGLVLMLGTPPIAVAHEDLDLQIADVTQKLESSPDDYRLHAKLGQLHGMHGDWPLAVTSLIHAQSLAPDAAAADLDLEIGQSLYHAGEPERALLVLERYLGVYEDSSEGWRILANVLGSLGETDAALLSFDRSIRLARVPTPETYFERARLLEGKADRTDELLAGIDEGIARLGPLSSLLEFAINIELQRENYSAAVARMDALPVGIGRQPRWLYKRSTTLLKLGQGTEAERFNRLALQAINDLPEQRRNAKVYATLLSDIENSYAAMISSHESAAVVGSVN